jgi:tellurite resistance protein TerC
MNLHYASPPFLILFLAFIALALALDLGVFHRRDVKMPLKDAIIWTIVWIVVAM